MIPIILQHATVKNLIINNLTHNKIHLLIGSYESKFIILMIILLSFIFQSFSKIPYYKGILENAKIKAEEELKHIKYKAI